MWVMFYVLGRTNHWFMYEVDSFASGISNWKANSPTYYAGTLQIQQLLCNILICFGNNFITLHVQNKIGSHVQHVNFYENSFITVDQMRIIKSCKLCLHNFSPKWWSTNATSCTPDQNVSRINNILWKLFSPLMAVTWGHLQFWKTSKILEV